jgi:glycosyltransferase involved in cell wall biosynthesis
LRDRLWGRELRRKTVVIRDAVDLTVFKPISRESARIRLGLPKDAVLIIFPHAISQPTKRLWLAEAAVGALSEWIPAARLWVVNGRPADEMAWYYAAADVMIVTSVSEGGPTSVKEALACGLPVVSVPVGDTDLFDEVPAGITRAEASVPALASALRQVITRPPQTRVNLLPPHLTLPAAARAIETLYREVISEARAAETQR